MGTRALTKVYDEDNKILVTIYSQYDGGDCLFNILKTFCENTPVVNGFSGSDQKAANGMGCLAAQLICLLKQGNIGGFYIYPAGAKDVGEEYIYKIGAPPYGKKYATVTQKIVK